MRKTLINLTRFGDLLQTQPIIDALGRQGHEISLVCLENFAGAAGLLTGVAHIAVLPGSGLRTALDRDWRLCLQALTHWLAAEKARFAPESVLNVTPTLPARLLSRLMGDQGQPEGFSLDPCGFGRNSTPWATYVEGVTLRRACSPFNLVDGFRRTAGVGALPARYALAEPEPALTREMEALLERTLEQQNFERPRAFVAFQLGASQDARRWPAASFAELGRILLSRAGLMPVLLGSKEERALAARYAEAGGPGLDLTGGTDLPRLAALLRLCRLLVSNDTGTMHLAAGLKVPVLGIFLATAQPWDTGPYQEGMCCLEPRLDCHPCDFSACPHDRPCAHDGACRAVIRGEDAAALILAWLESGRWPDLARPGETSGAGADSPAARARVWLTCRDGRGFMDLRSLSGDESADRTIWIRLQRDFYRRFLDAMEDGEKKQDAEPEDGARNEPADEPADEPAETGGAALSPDFRNRLLIFLDQADGLLLLVAEQGRLLASRPTDNARSALLASTARISRHFDASPDFAPLACLWQGLVQDYAENWTHLLSFFQTLRSHLQHLNNKIKSI